MKVFIEINPTKEQAKILANELVNLIQSLGQIVVPDIQKADMIISLGGDGTLINTWHKYFYYDLPIFGINCGHLGYLAEGTLDNYKQKIEKICQGNFHLEDRICLTGTLQDNANVYTAVNEFILNQTNGKMIEYSVIVDDQVIQTARGDGIICATPTGSTAYALSAGGSFIEPTVPAVELVGICPHSLMNRSIILPLNHIIQLQIHTPGILTYDGYHARELKPNDILSVKRCIKDLTLIKVDDSSFIERIAQNFCKI